MRTTSILNEDIKAMRRVISNFEEYQRIRLNSNIGYDINEFCLYAGKLEQLCKKIIQDYNQQNKEE